MGSQRVVVRPRDLLFLCWLTSCGVSTTPLVLPYSEAQGRVVAVRSSGEARWQPATTLPDQPIFVALPEGSGELVIADYAQDLRGADPCLLRHPTRVLWAGFASGTRGLLPSDFLEISLPETLAAILVPTQCAPACATFAATELMVNVEARTLAREGAQRFLVSTRAGQLLEVDSERSPPIAELCLDASVAAWSALWIAPDGASLFAGNDHGAIARLDLEAIRRDHRCIAAESVAVLSAAIASIDGGAERGGVLEIFAAGWQDNVAAVARLRDLVLTASASAPLSLPPTHRGSSLVRLGSDRALCTFDGQELLSWEAGALRTTDLGQSFGQEIESLLRLPDGAVLAAVRGHGLYRRSVAGSWAALGQAQGYEQVGAIVAAPDRWFFSTAQGGIGQWTIGGAYCPVAPTLGDNRYRLAASAGAGAFVIADAPRRGARAGTMIARISWSTP